MLSGGGSNQNPFASLGGAISSTQMRDDVLDGLFDPISITQKNTGHTDYFCIYIKNANGTSQMTAAKIWFTVINVWVSMGVGTSAAGGIEQSIANDTTPPAGINWGQPSTEATAFDLGNIPANSWRAVWFRRVFPAGGPATAAALFRFKVEALNA